MYSTLCASGTDLIESFSQVRYVQYIVRSSDCLTCSIVIVSSIRPTAYARFNTFPEVSNSIIVNSRIAFQQWYIPGGVSKQAMRMVTGRHLWLVCILSITCETRHGNYYLRNQLAQLQALSTVLAHLSCFTTRHLNFN